MNLRIRAFRRGEQAFSLVGRNEGSGRPNTIQARGTKIGLVGIQTVNQAAFFGAGANRAYLGCGHEKGHDVGPGGNCKRAHLVTRPRQSTNLTSAHVKSINLGGLQTDRSGKCELAVIEPSKFGYRLKMRL
jgi:hypothetical protein